MSRVAFVADVHLTNQKYRGGVSESGVNARARMTAGVLKRAVWQAVSLRCSALVVLGDAFGTSHPWPQLIALMQASLDPALPTYFVLGNHDMDSSSLGDHALAPLTALPGVYVIERPKSVEFGDVNTLGQTALVGLPRVQMGFVPFQPGPAHKWFPEAVHAAFIHQPTAPGIPRVLGFHLGIADAETAPFLRNADDAVSIGSLEDLCKRHGVTAAFAGNWHNRRRWDLPECSVLQCGTLCPTGFSNAGVDGYGTLAIWDSEAPNPKAAVTHLVIPGPRFLAGDDPAGFPEYARKATTAGNTVFVRLKAKAAGFQEAAEITQGWQDAGLCEYAEAVLDDTEATQAARDAVQQARGAESLDQAMAAYVGGMPLEAGIDRGAVQAEVQDCLRMAGAET